jgi:tetratricopeptide (TPR) repeat protein
MAKLKKAVPVLTMVSKVPAERIAEAVRAGAGHFIQKPFGPEELARMVDKAMSEAGRPVEVSAAKPVEPASASNRLLDEGLKALEKKDHELSARHFRQLINEGEHLPEAYAGMARSSEQSGDHGSARKYKRLASEEYAGQDMEEEAEALFRELVRDDPAADNPFKSLARRLQESGQIEKSAKALERASVLSPDDEEIFVELSRAYRRLGREDRALEVLRSILERGVDAESLKVAYSEIAGSDWYYGKAGEGPDFEVQIIDAVKPRKNGVENRRAERKAFADRAVRLPRVEEHLPVVDISRTGIGFKPMSVRFKNGQHIHFDLVAFDTIKIKKLKAVVRRVSRNVIGCEFEGLSDEQKFALRKMLE